MQNYFTLRRTPASSITSIKYDDNNVLDSDKYELVSRHGQFDIVNLKNVDNLPELNKEWFPIEITYTAGYTAIPKDIQQAVLYHIASM